MDCLCPQCRVVVCHSVCVLTIMWVSVRVYVVSCCVGVCVCHRGVCVLTAVCVSVRVSVILLVCGRRSDYMCS